MYSICGALRALFPCRCRTGKLPDFSADVCLVTGAGHGLGRLLAMKFAECGATMVLWDINEEGVRAVADEIREMGNEVFPYVCDCSKKEEVYRVAAQVKEEVGDVAVLVNNAGVVSGKKFVESNDASIERTFGVNTLSHFWVLTSLSLIRVFPSSHVSNKSSLKQVNLFNKLLFAPKISVAMATKLIS